MNYKIAKNPVLFDNNIINYCGKFMGNIMIDDLCNSSTFEMCF